LLLEVSGNQLHIIQVYTIIFHSGISEGSLDILGKEKGTQ